MRNLYSITAMSIAAAFLSGCVTMIEDPSYATTYLAEDGSVVSDARAKKIRKLALPKPAPKPRKVRHTHERSAPYEPPEPKGWWKGDSVAGAPSITINLTAQEAYFYKGTERVGWTPISTGKKGYETPVGNFKISQKELMRRSNLYGYEIDAAGDFVSDAIITPKTPLPAGHRYRGADMPHFMRVAGPVAMHGGILPGYPNSHGCIRLPLAMAEVFYNNTPPGTPVNIVK